MKYPILGAVALMALAGAAQATTFTYDFKAEANASGQIGEAIFSTFNTSGNGVFAGPNLKVTATKGGSSAFVYFDNGDAGMGVCGAGFSDGSGGTTGLNTYNSGSGANLCNPSSDDGLTTTDEALHFEATGQSVRITSFSINSNHDSGSILDTEWEIGGIVYKLADFDTSGVTPGGNSEGDIVIRVDFLLNAGGILNFEGITGPNSYISAIGVSAVPLPTAGLMLLAGLGGLGALRARKKSA